MGRYCSCSGAAVCPVTIPLESLEMRKSSWIPSPQMFQRLTWWKTQRQLGHVVGFVRFIPATTATTSSMEYFVCKTGKNPMRCRSCTALMFQVGDYRWPDGREYRGTSDPKFATSTFNWFWFWRQFCNFVMFFLCFSFLVLSGCPGQAHNDFSWCFFSLLISSNSSKSLSHIRVPSGNISVTEVERRVYARLWHVPILFSRRWQGAKSLPRCLQIESFIGVFCKRDTFASASWASRWTASLHLVPWSRRRPAARMKMNGWGQCYIFVLLFMVNNQGFYIVQYLIWHGLWRPLTYILAKSCCGPFDWKKATRVALCLCDEAKRAFLQEYGAQCVWFIVLEWYWRSHAWHAWKLWTTHWDMYYMDLIWTRNIGWNLAAV